MCCAGATRPSCRSRATTSTARTRGTSTCWAGSTGAARSGRTRPRRTPSAQSPSASDPSCTPCSTRTPCRPVATPRVSAVGHQRALVNSRASTHAVHVHVHVARPRVLLCLPVLEQPIRARGHLEERVRRVLGDPLHFTLPRVVRLHRDSETRVSPSVLPPHPLTDVPCRVWPTPRGA